MTGDSYILWTRHRVFWEEGIGTEDYLEWLRLLPAELRRDLEVYNEVEEIRLRCGYRPSFIVAGKEKEFSQVLVEERHILHVIDIATGASVHSSAEFLTSGFLNYRGIRIGVCGHAIYKDCTVWGFNKYTSLSIRIPGKLKDPIPDVILDELSSVPNNLIIAAPPGVGKTTALREIITLLSNKGFRIALLDERGEFAGDDIQSRLGKCTDILSFASKEKAAMMVLRTMNPQIIAMDEISKPEDAETVFEITGCGVAVIATIHAFELSDMYKRPIYKRLLSEGVFSKVLCISLHDGKRKYILERIGK